MIDKEEDRVGFNPTRPQTVESYFRSVRHLVLNRAGCLGDIMSGGADILADTLDGVAGAKGCRDEGNDEK
jgi:hypothetical protein